MESNLENLIKSKFTDLEKYIDSKFEENSKAHNRLEEHAKETNGNVKKNTAWRIKTEGQLKVLIGLFSIIGLDVIARIFLFLTK